MPRTPITLNPTKFQGQNVLFGDATNFDSANGMSMDNDGNSVFFINNTSGGAANITVTSVNDEALRTQDLTVQVNNGQIVRFGTFNPAWWNQADGSIYIDSDVGTDVKIYAFNLNLTTTS